MDEAILKAAKHVYDHIDDDVDISAELELLQRNIEDNGELNCDGFAISLDNIASTFFYDSELADWLDVPLHAIDDGARLNYMRETLQGAIEEPTDNDESFSIHKIVIDSDHYLLLCGIVTPVGHGFAVEWLKPTLSSVSLSAKFADLGFVTDLDDINALTDTHLLSLWH